MKHYTEDDVLGAIRQEAELSSLRQTALAHGFSVSYLSDLLKGKREVSQSVAESFGFEMIVKVVREVRFLRKKAA